MSYKQLSLEERHYIEIEHKKGTSQTDIASILGRSQSNISRELARNIGKKDYDITKLIALLKNAIKQRLKRLN